MPDYFLKKKSLLDRFKDNHGRTGYIQSARAKHTWSNPIKRNRRTKELNGWIKSFAGKKHIRKLARFNTLNNGKNEGYNMENFDCLRYGSTLELPNGVCIPVNAAIRCPRRAPFTFRITDIHEAEAGNPSKYVIRGYYPVYGPEQKPSDEFDIPCNDVSDIEQWIKTNEKGNSMQNEAMSLKGFIENLTEKLTKQFDLDEDEVKNYLDSHTEEMQILLDNKDMSLKEKVLFVRSEITGEKDEDKKSESVPESDYIQEFRSWLDAQEGEPYNEQEITDFGWEWKSQDVGYPNGNKTYYDYFSIEDAGVTYRLEVAWNSFNETIVGNKIWQDSSEAKTTDKSWQVDVSFDLDGNQEVAHVITDASSEAEAKKNAIAYVDSNYDGSTNVVIKDAKPLPKHKSERLFNKREMERIALSEGSKVSPYLVEIAHKILKDEYGWKASTLEEVADWLGDHKQAFEHAYGQALRSSDDDKANVKAGIEAALDEEEQGVMNAEIAMMGESKKHEGFNTTRDLDNFALHILNYIKDKTHYPGYVRFVKLNDDEEDFYGKYFLAVNGKNYYLYVGDTDYTITDNNDENTLVEGSTDLSGAMNKDLDDFCKRIQQPFYTESKEPTDEKLSYEKGHKNSKGENAPWVIRSHEDNRVLASFTNKKDAEEHLKRMKQYSKTEKMGGNRGDWVPCILVAKNPIANNTEYCYNLDGDWTPHEDNAYIFKTERAAEQTAQKFVDKLQRGHVAGFAAWTTKYTSIEPLKDSGSKSEDLETYACYIEFESESDAKEGMELVKGWNPTISKNLVVVEGLSKSAAEYLWKDWLDKCTDAGLDIKDKGEVYKDSIDESKDVSLKEIARTLDTAINKDGNYSVKDNTSGVTATDKDRTQTIRVSKDLKVELEDKDGKHSYEAQSLRDLSKYIRRAVKGEYVNEDFHKTQVKDAVYDVINRHNLNNAVKVSYLGNSVVCKYADRTLRIQPDLLTTMSTKDGDNIDTYPTNLKELDGYLDRVFGHYADELVESKQSEGIKLKLLDTITVPQWLWDAYTYSQEYSIDEYGVDLNDDEMAIFYDFKEKYKDCHLDDRGEEPDFHSRNDFDCYGGNCYIVDVYTETDVKEKKSEKLFNKQELEALARGADILDQLQYRFSFSFYSPKTYTDAVDTALAMNAEGDKRIAHETIGDSEFRLYTNDPYDAIRFRDRLSNHAGLPAEDLASTFRSAVGIRKNGGYATEDEQDTIGRYAAENYVSFSVSEDNSTMYVEGELPNVAEFFEAISSTEPA